MHAWRRDQQTIKAIDAAGYLPATGCRAASQAGKKGDTGDAGDASKPDESGISGKTCETKG